LFQKGRQRTGGREKGVPNVVTRDSREAIVQALNAYGRDGKGKDGMVGFCLRLLDENVENGLTLLQLITPRQLHAEVTRHSDVVYRTIGELDCELQKRGLPSSAEIFRLDFKGSEPAEEAEIVESQPDPTYLNDA